MVCTCSHFFVLLLFLATFLFLSLHCKLLPIGSHQHDNDKGAMKISPKFKLYPLHHQHHRHRPRRAIIKICVDFNRQPIPCKWETEAQLRKKFLACHLSIITMPFCHRKVPKINFGTRKSSSRLRNRGRLAL